MASHNFDSDKGVAGGGCSTTGSGKSLPIAKSSGGSSGGGCSSGGSCGSKSGEPKDVNAGIVQLNIGIAKAEKSKPKIEELPFAGTAKYPKGLMIGLDVGSTTVKYVVVDPITDEMLACDYQRHDTKQPEKCLEMLKVVEQKFPDVPQRLSRLHDRLRRVGDRPSDRGEVRAGGQCRLARG